MEVYVIYLSFLIITDRPPFCSIPKLTSQTNSKCRRIKRSEFFDFGRARDETSSMNIGYFYSKRGKNEFFSHGMSQKENEGNASK